MEGAPPLPLVDEQDTPHITTPTVPPHITTPTVALGDVHIFQLPATKSEDRDDALLSESSAKELAKVQGAESTVQADPPMPALQKTPHLVDGQVVPSRSHRKREGFVVGQFRVSYCPICLEAFTVDNPAILVPCRHVFHMQCFYAWRERSGCCAVCNAPFSDDSIRMMSGADVADLRSDELLSTSCSVSSFVSSPCTPLPTTSKPIPVPLPQQRPPPSPCTQKGVPHSRHYRVTFADSCEDASSDDEFVAVTVPAAGTARTAGQPVCQASDRSTPSDRGAALFASRAATACRSAVRSVRRVFSCFSTPPTRHPSSGGSNPSHTGATRHVQH